MMLLEVGKAKRIKNLCACVLSQKPFLSITFNSRLSFLSNASRWLCTELPKQQKLNSQRLSEVWKQIGVSCSVTFYRSLLIPSCCRSRDTPSRHVLWCTLKIHLRLCWEEPGLGIGPHPSVLWGLIIIWQLCIYMFIIYSQKLMDEF